MSLTLGNLNNKVGKTHKILNISLQFPCLKTNKENPLFINPITVLL